MCLRGWRHESKFFKMSHKFSEMYAFRNFRKRWQIIAATNDEHYRRKSPQVD
jgi:hypothetical protein